MALDFKRPFKVKEQHLYHDHLLFGIIELTDLSIIYNLPFTITAKKFYALYSKIRLPPPKKKKKEKKKKKVCSQFYCQYTSALFAL